MLGKHLWDLLSVHTIIAPLCCQCHTPHAADRYCVSDNATLREIRVDVSSLINVSKLTKFLSTWVFNAMSHKLFGPASLSADLQHENAMRHAQRRIADLLHKADAVDKTEYERVVTALKAAEGRLASLEAEAARLQPLADQLEPLQAKVAKQEVTPSVDLKHPHSVVACCT